MVNNSADLEIMSPAGNFECLTAAIKAGANSVYFGVDQLNMRARAANNFSLADLPKIVEICSEKNVKTYLTLNTIMYDHDMNLMKKMTKLLTMLLLQMKNIRKYLPSEAGN